MIEFKKFKVVLEEASPTGDYAKIRMEPVPRGYGTTIGNSLRRVLLSSIAGAAVTYVRIENVFHKFSIIPNVREDVIEFISNLQKVPMKVYTDEPRTLKLHWEGSGVVKSGDLVVPPDVEILDKGVYLLECEEEAEIDATIGVKRGRGFVEAERHRPEDVIEDFDPGEFEDFPIGIIPVDSNFSPVKKVSFRVEELTSETAADFERLIVEVYTDITVNAVDAVKEGVAILVETWREVQSKLSSLKSPNEIVAGDLYSEEVVEEESEVVSGGEGEELPPIYQRPLEELGLSTRLLHLLQNHGIKTIGDLVEKTEEELRAIEKLGEKSIKEIKEKLAGHSLVLASKEGEKR